MPFQDKNGETNVRNDEDMEIIRGKARDDTFCDEFVIIREEVPVRVADSLLPLMLEVNKKNDTLGEVEVMKVDKETMTTDCNQVGDACNDLQLPLRIDGNKKPHSDDQLGLDEKALKQGEECDGKGDTIIQRKDILVEGAHSVQPGTDDDPCKLEDECDGNGKIILEEGDELIQAAVVDQTRPDEKPDMRGKECDDDPGIVIEKGEELIGEAAANEMILSEELEATTMYGDEDVLCSDGTVLNKNDIETCNSKIPELLLPLIDSLSVTKPGDNDLFEDHLVVEVTMILKGDEANVSAIAEDRSKVEDMEQTQLVEANGDNKEYYTIYRENTNDKFEEADVISVKNDQQMQSWEECQKIHIDVDQEKYNSDKSLPEINTFQGNGFKVQEFSFPPLDSPFLFKPGKLHKYDSAETTQQVEVINTTETDGLAEEVFAYQIVLENKPSVQLARNDEMQSYNDVGDNVAAKAEETLKTSIVDIAQPIKSSEEEVNNDDNKEDEKAVGIIQRENLEVENNLQLPEKDDNNINKDEFENNDFDVEDDDGEEDISSESEEEDNVEEVEESSETTGDSSLDSNTEAIWPDESVLEFSQKVKDIQANNQKYFREIKEEDSYVKFNIHKVEDDDGDTLMTGHSDKLSADTTTLKQPTNMFNLKSWFLSLLVPFLLLLCLFLSQLSYFASFHYHLE